LALVATNMFRKQRTEALVGVAFIALGALVYGVGRLASPNFGKSGTPDGR
jgi:hypothetical protein